MPKFSAAIFSEGEKKEIITARERMLHHLEATPANARKKKKKGREGQA